MQNRIVVTRPELAQALSVSYATIAELETAADPLPFFEIEGSIDHYYPLTAVDEWAVRQCKKRLETVKE